MMKMTTHTMRSVQKTVGFWLVTLLALSGVIANAYSAEIESIAWEAGGDSPVLQVRGIGADRASGSG